jgi:homoserine kinase
VAGVFAVSELLRTSLSKSDLLPFALDGEAVASGARHADNVAPSLLGGIQLAVSHDPPMLHRLPVPKGLFVTVVYPHVEVLTRTARQILSPTVPLPAAVQQMSHLSGFIVGLFRSDFELIGHTLHDVLIEPQRATLIPEFRAVQNAALEAGVLGCSISGAGPSIFALSANSLVAERAGEAMVAVYRNAKIECDLYVSPVNQEGAILC